MKNQILKKLKTDYMTLKEIIRKEFGINLPISGGMGNSIDNAIVIDKLDPMMDCVSIEHEVLKYMSMIRGEEFNLIFQELLFHEEKTIDKLKVEISKILGGHTEAREEDFYFDITASFGNKSDLELEKETEQKFKEMKRFLDIMLDDKENGNSH
jgi:phage tail tube protein FII